MSTLVVEHAASADDRELAVHVELAAGLSLAEDAQDNGATSTMPSGGLSLRGTYGVTDQIAAEVCLGAIVANGAEFADQMVDDRMGTLVQDERAVRLTSGIALRLGVRWIPTLTARIGYQHRWLTDACIVDGSSCLSETLATRGVNDLIVSAAAGLDYRLNARWVIGVSAQFTHAFSLDGNSFDVIEVPITIGFYWYP